MDQPTNICTKRRIVPKIDGLIGTSDGLQVIRVLPDAPITQQLVKFDNQEEVRVNQEDS